MIADAQTIWRESMSVGMALLFPLWARVAVYSFTFTSTHSRSSFTLPFTRGRPACPPASSRRSSPGVRRATREHMLPSSASGPNAAVASGFTLEGSIGLGAGPDTWLGGRWHAGQTCMRRRGGGGGCEKMQTDRQTEMRACRQRKNIYMAAVDQRRS